MKITLYKKYDFASQRIDAVARRIEGAVVMKANVPAVGHGIETDDKTIAMLESLGNAKTNVLMGFGHPGVSENRLGKGVAYSTNYRVKGDDLLCDIAFRDSAKLSPVFTRDPAEYLIALAKEDPKSLGLSVVIHADTAWKREDGSEFRSEDFLARPEWATNKTPVIRPTELHYTDFVAEGAVTPNGLFGYGDAGSEIANKAVLAMAEYQENSGLSLDDTLSDFATFLSGYANSDTGGYSNDGFSSFMDQFRERFGLSREKAVEKAAKFLSDYSYRSNRMSDTTDVGVLQDAVDGNVALAAELDKAVSSDAMQTFRDDFAALKSEVTALEASFAEYKAGIATELGKRDVLISDLQKTNLTALQTVQKLLGQRVVTDTVPKTPVKASVPDGSKTELKSNTAADHFQLEV